MESICAVIFTLILMFPLVLQLQMLILEPRKLYSMFHYYAAIEDTPSKPSSPKLLQHYPNHPVIFNINSDSKISLTNLRTVSSSPELPQSPASPEITIKPSRSVLLAAKHSCTFVKTDRILPVVDIGWNYSSYRHKAFESCLRNRYGDKYPPGEVVLNSMHLNLFDSCTNASSVAGLFDFVKDSEPTLNCAVAKKLEIEYLNPLDHFVTRTNDKPATEERFTETVADQRRSSDNAVAREHPIRDVITAREKNTVANRRSGRKIVPSKCNLSSPRRVRGDGTSLKSNGCLDGIGVD